MNIFPGYISEGWRGFLRGIDQKPEAGVTFRGVSTKSRRPSGRNVFLGYISGRWRGFLLSIDPKPKAVRNRTFSGYCSRPLGEPHDRWEKAAGGCLISTFFQGISPKTGGTFCGVLTKSQRSSGAVLFRDIAAGHLSGFPQRIDQKPEAVRHERFFRTHLRRLAGLFAGDRPKAEGYLVSTFFWGTSPGSGGAFCRVSTKSRRLPGVALFRAIAAGRSGSLAVGGKRQPEADGRKHFSGVYLRRLERLFAQYRSKAGGCPELHFFGASQQAT